MNKIVLIFFICTINSFSQTGWYWQNPLPQSNDLLSVSFLNVTSGFATGKYGTMLKTTDGGDNWLIIDLPSTYHYSQIKFTNPSTGYILRSDNKILKTTNSGLNWFVIYTSAYPINDLYFISSNSGIMSVNCSLLKTSDGGQSWYNFFSPPTNERTYSVYCLNDTCIYAGGIKRIPISPSGYTEVGIFYKTTNAGNNWTSVTINSLSNVSKIYFYNSATGYIFNQSGYLARTSNMGSNWQIFQHEYNTINSIRFINSLTGFLSTSEDSVYISSNGGNNWSPYFRGVRQFEFINSNTIIGVGLLGHILKSTNSGIQFVDKRVSVTDSWLNTIQCVSESVSYAGGGNNTGVIIKTTNGGKYWFNQHSGIDDFITGIHFINEYNGAAVSKKYILHTTNGGNNWITQYFKDSSYFENIIFVDENTGFAGGRNNLLLKTSDGGINWINLPLGNGLTYSGMQFLNQQTGFIFGGNFSGVPKQNLFKTTNKGLNWTGFIGPLEGIDIYFINENTGIVSGWLGKIFRSTNGGINWDSCNSVTTESLNSITFINSSTGFIAGRASTTLLKTTDAGITWNLIPLNMSYDAHWLYSISSYNGEVTFVGNNGLIKSTKPGGGIGINKINTVIPCSFSLSQNYPNPFNPTSLIRFNVKEKSPVSLKIFNSLGAEISVLVNETLSPGEYEATFDGTLLPSGVYFYRLRAGDYSETKKMVLIK